MHRIKLLKMGENFFRPTKFRTEGQLQACMDIVDVLRIRVSNNLNPEFGRKIFVFDMYQTIVPVDWIRQLRDAWFPVVCI